MLHFTELSIPTPIELQLGNIRNQKSEMVKNLGLVFNSKLKRKTHTQQLKSKCNKAPNLMRSVSSTEWGADQKILMMILISMVRSKIDYGCIVYNSVSLSELKDLESVSNEAMRISRRCFNSTPMFSPQVITEEPRPRIRRDKLSLEDNYKVKSLLQNSAFKFIIPVREAPYTNKNSPPLFAFRTLKLHTILNLEHKGVLPDFSYFQL